MAMGERIYIKSICFLHWKSRDSRGRRPLGLVRPVGDPRSEPAVHLPFVAGGCGVRRTGTADPEDYIEDGCCRNAPKAAGGDLAEAGVVPDRVVSPRLGAAACPSCLHPVTREDPLASIALDRLRLKLRGLLCRVTWAYPMVHICSYTLSRLKAACWSCLEQHVETTSSLILLCPPCIARLVGLPGLL